MAGKSAKPAVSEIRHEARDVSAGDLAPLVGQLRQLIAEARSRVLRAVDVIQVQTCWQVGRPIVEFEQGGQ